MRYHEVSFKKWMQPRIRQLREEGKYVYPVFDDGEGGWYIKHEGWTGNFLVTDEPLLPEDEEQLDYIEIEIALEDGYNDPEVSVPETNVDDECLDLRRELKNI